MPVEDALPALVLEDKHEHTEPISSICLWLKLLRLPTGGRHARWPIETIQVENGPMQSNLASIVTLKRSFNLILYTKQLQTVSTEINIDKLDAVPN